MEVKGLIFSPDAMFGIMIITILFSSAILITGTEPKNYPQKYLLYQKATDDSQWRFYTGKASPAAPAADDISCSVALDYTSNGNLTNKVTACKSI